MTEQEKLDKILDYLDSLRTADRLEYNDYSDLHDMVSRLTDNLAEGDRAVSLNAVIDVMHEMWGNSGELLDAIKELPPVTPQRPKGHWIMKHRNINKIEYHTGEDVLNDEIHTVKELIRYETDDPYCSECGKRTDDIAQDFCGYCGCRMR